jgi:cupin fold WbuC family metalloprotein
MNGFTSLTNEVSVATGGVVRVRATDCVDLVERGKASKRKRARLCAHPESADPLHEMLICLARGTYVRPHRHPGKSESFHIIEGVLDVVLFADDGTIREVIQMGPYHTGGVFYYRLIHACFHTVLVNTQHVLFHETTNGPFDPADTEFAPWAPEEGEESVASYLTTLRLLLRQNAGACV